MGHKTRLHDCTSTVHALHTRCTTTAWEAADTSPAWFPTGTRRWQKAVACREQVTRYWAKCRRRHACLVGGVCGTTFQTDLACLATNSTSWRYLRIQYLEKDPEKGRSKGFGAWEDTCRGRRTRLGRGQVGGSHGESRRQSNTGSAAVRNRGELPYCDPGILLWSGCPGHEHAQTWSGLFRSKSPSRTRRCPLAPRGKTQPLLSRKSAAHRRCLECSTAEAELQRPTLRMSSARARLRPLDEKSEQTKPIEPRTSKNGGGRRGDVRGDDSARENEDEHPPGGRHPNNKQNKSIRLRRIRWAFSFCDFLSLAGPINPQPNQTAQHKIAQTALRHHSVTGQGKFKRFQHRSPWAFSSRDMHRAATKNTLAPRQLRAARRRSDRSPMTKQNSGWSVNHHVSADPRNAGQTYFFSLPNAGLRPLFFSGRKYHFQLCSCALCLAHAQAPTSNGPWTRGSHDRTTPHMHRKQAGDIRRRCGRGAGQACPLTITQAEKLEALRSRSR